MEMATGGQDIIKGTYWGKKNADLDKDLYMGSIHLLFNNLSFKDPKGKKEA